MNTKGWLFCLCSLIFILSASVQPGNARLKRILLVASPDSKDSIRILEEYEYDEQCRISKVTYPMYKDGKIAGTMSFDLYEYNTSGQLTGIRNNIANIQSPSGFICLKNIIYTYSEDGRKLKESFEYPQAVLSEYSLFIYEKGRLAKIEKYGYGGTLESYIVNEYNASGEVIKEATYSKDGQRISETVHFYSGGLNIRSDVYISGDRGKEHLREIIRTFDDRKNLIILESKELLVYSSQSGYVWKYEYN
jgi:hypothetical protein